MRWTQAGLVLLLAGCGGDSSPSDGDGPMPAEVDGDGDGFSEAEDCDDADATVFPGADDIWYDGVDSDCLGNDDFDQDGDGFALDDECNDFDADVSPDEVEVPYDGVDNDCNEATSDVDVDGDGFEFADDCDDDDVGSYPGAPERLGDAVDSDCDGGPDTTAFSFSDLLWEGPSAPRVVANDQHVVVALVTSSLQDGADDPQVQLGAAMWFDPLSSGVGVEPLDAPLVWIGATSDDEYRGIDVEASGDDIIVGAAYYSVVSLFGWTAVQELTWVEALNSYALGPGYFRGEPALDHDFADLMIDGSGVAWAVACDDDTLSYVQGVGAFPNPGGGLTGVVDGSAGCFFDDVSVPPVATACAVTGGCVTFDLDPELADPSPRLAASQPWVSESWTQVRDQSGVLTVLPEGGGVTVVDGSDRWDLLTDVDVIDASAVVDGTGELFLAAVVDDGSGYAHETLLVYGDPTAPSEASLVLEDVGRDLVPLSAAVAVTDDRVVVVVTGDDVTGVGGQDALGWIFFQR